MELNPFEKVSFTIFILGVLSVLAILLSNYLHNNFGSKIPSFQVTPTPVQLLPHDQ